MKGKKILSKLMKVILGTFGVILIGIGILVVIFFVEMKPDQEEEEKIRLQAEEYLEEAFNADFEIYDTLYDNMGNFPGFEYAAKVRDKKNDIEFLIYYDEETNQMVDTYVADKWENELEKNLRGYLNEKMEGLTDFYVTIPNSEIGKELGIDPLQLKSYKKFNIRPIIRLTFSRERSSEDEKIVQEFITYLKEEAQLNHGTVNVEYIAEDGVILDEEWGREF